MLSEIVNLSQRNTGSIIHSASNSRVRTRRKAGNDSRFAIVAGSEPARLDLGLLRTAHPIVVREEERAVVVTQLKFWIGKAAGKWVTISSQ